MFISPTSLALALFLLSSAAAAPTPHSAARPDHVVPMPKESMTAAQHAAALQIEKQIEDKLHPKPDQAVFWSGSKMSKKGKPVSVKRDAQKYATAAGKQTINQALAKNNIKIPPPSMNPASARIWEKASETWASRSKGEVNAFVGDKHPNSVYDRIEKPTLIRNNNVNKVVEHDKVKNTITTVHQKEASSPVHQKPGTRSTVHQQGKGSTVHQKGTSSTVHQQGTSSTVHQQGKGSTVHQKGTSSTVHQKGKSSTVHKK
ncbi:hypothetical protein Hypma_012664 [Hypsizygus marmoreus]|uniref:Uncharacterized protein n=1 Tax=Hypsizygus marmoreus TaxID=39966 RepID=A0A369JDK9_HYPMA|nr:hypothetical protein Hypma_012664 [Hypsizygus marmoreus]